MDLLSEDIKNKSFSRVYLLYGEEDYLRNSYKKRLSDAVVPQGDNMNRTVFMGKDASAEGIMELSETMPFLSDRRLILVEDSMFFKNAVDDRFTEYIGQIPEGTVMIFSESEVDSRKKLFKAVKKYGKVISCDTPSEEELVTWSGGYLSRNGKKVRRKTVELLLARVGSDMNMLRNEMDKLISYSGDREEITADDVTEACSLNINSSIFAMIDDIAEGRQKKALERYYELLLLKEAPMRILFLLTREFNILLISKDLEKKKVPMGERAGIMKVPAFAVRKYNAAAGRFTEQQILNAVEDCVDTENDIKKGRISDRLGVELLIIKYSGRKAERQNA